MAFLLSLPITSLDQTNDPKDLQSLMELQSFRRKVYGASKPQEPNCRTCNGLNKWPAWQSSECDLQLGCKVILRIAY
jgi:hypothetical protein